jgi:hypothetical protein
MPKTPHAAKLANGLNLGDHRGFAKLQKEYKNGHGWQKLHMTSRTVDPPLRY